MRTSAFLFLLVYSIALSQTHLITFTGKISDKISGKSIPDCNVVLQNKEGGTTSDNSGIFTFKLLSGSYTVQVSHIGYKTDTIDVEISNDIKSFHIDIELTPISIVQEEVNVYGKVKYSSVDVQVLTNEEIKKMPSFNYDVLQSVAIMPGVTANNELSSDYSVRGGNYNENLVYLNGYEIYRPFLILNGMQENQTIANPDLVKEINFYNGAFSASFGNKMSSALEINYRDSFQTNLGGKVRANLLNSGLSLHSRFKNFSWSAAFRYTYPSLFMKGQQLEGSYSPSFRDGQVLANYTFPPNDKIELLAIYASNKFDLTPKNWQGDFTRSRGDIDVISGYYSGYKLYSFNIGLFGIKYLKTINTSTFLTTSISSYFMTEKENNDLSGNFYYSPDQYNLENDKEFLKTSYETADDNLNLKVYEIKTQIDFRDSLNHFSSGIDFRLTNLDGNIKEDYYETGPQATQTLPDINLARLNYNLNSIGAFAQDVILLSKEWKLNAGIRYLHYSYNNENLFSPRAGISFYPSEKHTLKFMFGHYYQPPFFQELKYTNGQILKSQRAIHYVLGWDFQFLKHVKLLTEVYYKKLDRLIPFNLDEVKIEYLTDKITNGYAYGFDVQVQGELVKGANSWISYSYLDTKEKVNGVYLRRLLDQTHTLQIFLQDRFPKYPNWQAHVRLLAGTGYLFYPEFIRTDANGKKYLYTDFNHRIEYSPCLRTDMGLTTEFDFGDNKKITIKAEVLNLFNNYNNAGYKWIQVRKDSNSAIAIYQQISGRFFNIGAELEF
jgi:outer membrane receptor protein involved in Fe transport